MKIFPGEQEAHNATMAGEQAATFATDAAILLAVKAQKRERQLYAAIVLGVIWSFTYTAISLLIMYGVASQTNVSCEQFADSREDVRALILSSPQFQGAITAETLDEILPPVSCD